MADWAALADASGVDAQALIGFIRDIGLAAAVFIVTGLLTRLDSWVKARARDAAWQGANDRLARLAADAVEEVGQAFVRVAKADPDAWTDAAKAEARALAESIVRRHLGERGIGETAARLGVSKQVLDGRIVTLIEGSIARQKRAPD